MKVLDAQELLQLAQDRTGLSDFGPEDFREGLDMLVKGVNADVVVRPDRVEHLRENILRLLINRLWFQKDLADHPEILDEVIDAPIIITSLPRTGSTKLQRLLAASGDFQLVEYWKGHMFARIPGAPDGGREQRIAETRAYEKWLYEVSPDMITGHPVFTDEAEEEMQLFEYSFRTPALAVFGSASYFGWLLGADPTPAYDYLKTQLQYLQWQNPENRKKPWLLKTPIHFGLEPQVNRIFDNPRFIVTHRDPIKCIPSIAGVSHNWHMLYADVEPDLTGGEAMITYFGKSAVDHLAWRDSDLERQILDIGFSDITSNDGEVVRRIYEEFGLPLTEKSQQGMREWSERNPRNKHGGHSYSAAKFGTTDDVIRTSFADYIDRFAPLLA
ncbi:sulfotransferase family protein [Rhizorhabdus argentea]|uniref:sulfotransferase family protein n=1 Tax=Rhizorhabdus argentea TaxID=1387174 RepID=UPI0030EDF55F